MENLKPKYKRIMLKISGEALAGEKGFGLDQPTINKIAAKIKECYDLGIEISIVIGGGNFWAATFGEGATAKRWTERVPTIWECLQR